MSGFEVDFVMKLIKLYVPYASIKTAIWNYSIKLVWNSCFHTGQKLQSFQLAEKDFGMELDDMVWKETTDHSVQQEWTLWEVSA